MIVLTQAEAEELVEHFESRPDIWTLHENVWFRKLVQEEGAVALALQVRNGLDDNLYALTFRQVRWGTATTSEYVKWLLEKYTAFDTRMKVVKILEKHKVGGHSQHFDALSRDLCELQGGTFVRRHERRSQERGNWVTSTLPSA